MNFKFLATLIYRIKNDKISSVANALTYKLLLALFPLIIFVMSLLGFLNLDSNKILNMAAQYFYEDIMNVINVFIDEVIDVKSTSILSSSLIVTIASASTGFKAIIESINKAYGYEESRSFLKIRLISVLMVFIFGIIIIGATVLLLFGDSFNTMLITRFNIDANIIAYLFGFSTYLITIAIMLVVTMFIYMLASCKKLTFVSVFPGAFVTVLGWIISSKIFNVYIANFSKYSKVYGSIGGIFILVVWLNLISFTLLLGGEINAIIDLKK